jgi:hypothetical protein
MGQIPTIVKSSLPGFQLRTVAAMLIVAVAVIFANIQLHSNGLSGGRGVPYEWYKFSDFGPSSWYNWSALGVDVLFAGIVVVSTGYAIKRFTFRRSSVVLMALGTMIAVGVNLRPVPNGFTTTIRGLPLPWYWEARESGLSGGRFLWSYMMVDIVIAAAVILTIGNLMDWIDKKREKILRRD